MSEGLGCFLFETEFRCFLKKLCSWSNQGCDRRLFFFCLTKPYWRDCFAAVSSITTNFDTASLISTACWRSDFSKSDINLVSSVVCGGAKNFLDLESGAHLNCLSRSNKSTLDSLFLLKALVARILIEQIIWPWSEKGDGWCTIKFWKCCRTSSLTIT